MTLSFDFHQQADGTWIGSSNTPEEPLNGAALSSLSIRLEPAGDTNGRKTWHVDIEGDIAPDIDDATGHKHQPGRGICHGC